MMQEKEILKSIKQTFLALSYQPATSQAISRTSCSDLTLSKNLKAIESHLNNWNKNGRFLYLVKKVMNAFGCNSHNNC